MRLVVSQMNKTRSVRFTQEENEAIENVLKMNPFLDFSTIARFCVLNFLKNPVMKIESSSEKKVEGEKKNE